MSVTRLGAAAALFLTLIGASGCCGWCQRHCCPQPNCCAAPAPPPCCPPGCAPAAGVPVAPVPAVAAQPAWTSPGGCPR